MEKSIAEVSHPSADEFGDLQAVRVEKVFRNWRAEAKIPRDV